MSKVGQHASTKGIPIFINVYDLMPESRLTTFMWYSGISICHSGIVINNREWAFGGHDVPGITGVYVTQPREVPDNATYRTTISIGQCLLSHRQIQTELDRLRNEFTGPSYDLLNRNCNHFVEEVCIALCKKTPPAWVNRIAGLGARLREPSIRAKRLTIALCVSQTWVNPPVAELDPDLDTAQLLPPSETAPMFRSTNMNVYHNDCDESAENLNDLYLTEASGGHRVSIGTV